ncbi:hypothetical protein QNI19_20050 [Cytophagaceae bacterium DM2B3-1]|uniref:Uncharacterized protein n=1 Tax=Xanthocytophaga flava TaxID=3048013 RepID=A0ABT7CNB6_9BACT|nr:hypothetical protein [Xanthocytophaga flavus]MDJ1495243.1 hypothetical protein [Xanthocytophaga flavus]
MIKFEKNISQLLPYNRANYIAYFNDEDDTFDRNVIWYGVSLQQADIKDQKLYQVSEQIVVNSVDRLENAFKEIVSEFDQGLPWIINHDDKDLPWFNTENKRMPQLQNLFKQNTIPSSFIGCLVFNKEDVVNFARELITYPYDLLSKISYKTLDVSHTKLPLILKLTGHLTLDIVSTDKALLTKISHLDKLDSFLKIPYRSRE